MQAKWTVPVAVSSLFLFLFFCFKVIRFQELYYTFNDMYIFLQASYSWLNGRPLLYENIWGYDDRIHNNYAMLLWGPLIYVSGAYGAFAIQAGLFIASYGLILRQISRRMLPWAVWLFLFVLLLGPVWFWMNDHPGIGWHPELTYLPLSLLFVWSLLTYQTTWFWVTAGLIVLVKEDGALLAGSIHLAFLSIQYLTTDRQRTAVGVLTKSRFWLVAAGWAAVFVLGMAFLSYKNHSAEPEPRLQKALQAISNGLHNPVFLRKNLELLIQTLLLLLPSISILLYGLSRVSWRQTGSVVLIYTVAQLALLLSNWVQGSTYYGENPFFELVSLTWPPRFVLQYAFSITYILTVWSLFGIGERPLASWKPFVIGAVLFLIQIPIVQYARPDFRVVTMLRDLIRHRVDPFKEPMLPARDVAVIEKIADTIPAHSNVFIFDFLIPIFHKHYNIWPTEKQWENADLAIIPNKDFQSLAARLPRVMKKPYRPISLDTYTIFVTPAYEPYVKAALADKSETK